MNSHSHVNLSIYSECILPSFSLLQVYWSNLLLDLLSISGLASVTVSSISVLLIAVDQLIVFKLDPFGVKNILTKARRIIICLLTWMIMTVMFILELRDFVVVLWLGVLISPLLIFLTCIIYILVYRAIARAPVHDDIQQVELERRRDNAKRVLWTYALILGTNVVFFSIPDTMYVALALVEYYSGVLPTSRCVISGFSVMVMSNTIANTLIYWCRTREFRAIFCNSRMLVR